MYIYHKSIDFKSVQHHSSKQMSLVSPVTSIKQYDQKISRENLLKFLNSNIFAFWVLIWFFFQEYNKLYVKMYYVYFCWNDTKSSK